MKQTVATYSVENPAGSDFGGVDMTANVEYYGPDNLTKSNYGAEERYESTPALAATPWRATLEATDYCREIGWFATQAEAVTTVREEAEIDAERIWAEEEHQ